MLALELKTWRESRKLTQEQLAKYLAISKRTMIRYENEDGQMPYDMELRLASVLKNHPMLDWKPQPNPTNGHAPRYRAGFYSMAGEPLTYATYPAAGFYVLHIPEDGWQVLARGSAWAGKCDGADPSWRALPPWEDAASYADATMHADRCYFPMHETAPFKRTPASDKPLPVPTYILTRKGLCHLHEKW